jgi:uncharacterized protein YkwD
MQSHDWLTLMVAVLLGGAFAAGCGAEADSMPFDVGDVGVDAPPDSASDTEPKDLGPDTSRDTAPDGQADTADGADVEADGTQGSDVSCSGTRRMCDGTCTELLSNPNHCGKCGRSCHPDAECINGICDCPEEMLKCDGTCIDPTSNDDHCFECGNACADGKACVNSVCVKADPTTKILQLTNQARQTQTDCGNYGVKPASQPLTRNAELDKAAQAHAESMAQNGFFAHTDPTDGSTYITRVGETNYQGTPIHENLARGLRQSPEMIVEGWLGSPNHCRGIANPDATEIGIGFVRTNSGMWDTYWVQVFGR